MASHQGRRENGSTGEALLRASSLRKILFGYAFRNALLPVVTTLGMVFSFVLGANVLVEKVFAVPSPQGGGSQRTALLPHVLSLVTRTMGLLGGVKLVRMPTHDFPFPWGQHSALVSSFRALHKGRLDTTRPR